MVRVAIGVEVKLRLGNSGIGLSSVGSRVAG